MATYRVGRNAYVAVKGNPRPQIVRAGQVIQTDAVPAVSWEPLDDEAIAAVEAHRAEQPYTRARNGVQSIDSRTGAVMVTPASVYQQPRRI